MKIKLVVKNLNGLAFKAQKLSTELQILQTEGSNSNDIEDVVYITFMEGSDDVYGYCSSVCEKEDEPLMYTEVTSFPDFGNLYRCQCGTQYSKWYEMDTHAELSLDIILGDEVFNNYVNMNGNDNSDCDCYSLKNMLYKLINS